MDHHEIRSAGRVWNEMRSAARIARNLAAGGMKFALRASEIHFAAAE
jgi:hypothetical protein